MPLFCFPRLYVWPFIISTSEDVPVAVLPGHRISAGIASKATLDVDHAYALFHSLAHSLLAEAHPTATFLNRPAGNESGSLFCVLIPEVRLINILLYLNKAIMGLGATRTAYFAMGRNFVLSLQHVSVEIVDNPTS